MKTPEEIKKGLECGFCHECPYDNNKFETVEECARQVHKDALAYINQLEDAIDKTTQLIRSAIEVTKKSQEQLESTYSQVKKALCGKENVSLVEVLEAVDQLKDALRRWRRREMRRLLICR